MRKRLFVVLFLSLLLVAGSSVASLAADPGFVDGRFTTTRKITVEIYDRSNPGGSPPEDNFFTDFIKKGMLEKYNVEVEYVPVPRWTEVEVINNLLAAGDAPDVCVTYSYPTIQTYANMGGVLDLAPTWKSTKTCCPTCLTCWGIPTSTGTKIPTPAPSGPLKLCSSRTRRSTPL